MTTEFLRNSAKVAFRQFRKQPGISASIVVTLALAIGANTAIFSFVNALLLKPFPFHEPDRLIEIYSVRGGQRGKLSMREVLDIKERVGAIESIAAHTGSAGGYNYSGDRGGKPEEWRAILTTGNLLHVLGLPLTLGGPWPEHSNRERDFRVILSYEIWQRSFGGRADVIGKTITLDHAPGYVIHGVAAPGLDFPHGVDVYRSIGGFTNYVNRGDRNVVAIARIKAGNSVVQLQSELDALSARLTEAYPASNAGLVIRSEGFREVYAGDVRAYLILLAGAVGFVLLIACANVANLLLSRALAREREIGVKVAIGAGRGHIFLELLTESTLLAAISALCGVVLAGWWVKALRKVIGTQLPQWLSVDLDPAVLLFTAAVAVFAAVVCGLAPAIHLARTSLSGMLREGGRAGTSGPAAGRLRDAMIAAEVAFALMLLSAAGLLIQGFSRLQSQSTGFNADNVQTFRVALGWRRYGGERVTQYYERALSDLGRVPGITGVAIAPSPPLARQQEFTPDTVQLEGQSAREALRNPYVVHQSVSEAYFDLLRIPLKAGRSFTHFDGPTSEQVAIVSERLATRLWPGESPIGKRLRYGPMARNPLPMRVVVGIAGNVQQTRLGGEPGLDLYVPYRQAPTANQYVLARTRLSEAQFRRHTEQVMYGIDSEQSFFDLASYQKRILDSVWQLRLSRSLLFVFAFVALVLAAIGIYSVMAYLVGQRTRELGIRLALGATPGEVQALVVRRSATVGGVGLSIGLAGAVALGVIAQGWIADIEMLDSMAYAVALLALGCVILGASWIPALRASRIDPASTLRVE
ncbi:MAG TPA: ABC transporter permease [Bryobacteraceae bacterium]|nr:ABC transporter permease [Bryobacteraceae bacterium]